MARELVEQRKDKEKEERNKLFHKVTLDNLFDSIQQGEMKELNIIVKADVQGSVEAVRSSLEKLSNDEVRVRVIHGAVGAINESDVMLAAASGAIIVGFNVRPDRTATDSAAQQGVDMRMYRVIYDAIEEMEQAMKGMLEPKFKEVVLGHAEVRQVFKITGAGAVAGCYVQDGKIQRNAEVRVVRDGIVFHEGHLNTLKRFKDDVKEVAAACRCGMSIENYNDIKEGDIIECFVMEEVKIKHSALFQGGRCPPRPSGSETGGFSSAAAIYSGKAGHSHPQASNGALRLASKCAAHFVHHVYIVPEATL